jgi:hypothetical protein
MFRESTMKFRTVSVIAVASMLVMSCAMHQRDHRGYDAHHLPAAGDPGSMNQMPMMEMQKNMHGQMQKMQETMDKIHQAKSPQERQKLMDEHMSMMQDGMGMMRDMHAARMDMKERGMMGNTKMGDGQMPMCGVDGAEQRMDMMEQMLEQMKQHQAEQIKSSK